jgi:hypothetical protein
MYGIICFYIDPMTTHNLDAHKPGGAGILRKYSVVAKRNTSYPSGFPDLDASWAFGGGLNNHSRAARRRMEELRVANLKMHLND